MRASVQHEGAHRLLSVLRHINSGDAPLTYASMAERIGRPRKDARAVAQMCDLLDAAAAYSRTPLLALTAVLARSGKVNPKAWAGPGIPSTLRDEIIARSRRWNFSSDDYDAIERGLNALQGLGNRNAWERLRQEVMPFELAYFVAGLGPTLGTDVDAGAIEGQKKLISHLRRERNTSLADEKRRLAMTSDGLKCEACGSYSELMYPGIDAAIWEVHHKVPLSELDAPVKTLLKDLAVLCPSCHRAIHRTQPMLSVNEFAKRFFSLNE